MTPGKRKYWRQLPADEYAALFPSSPPALRKIAHGLRQLGANGADTGHDIQPRTPSGDGRGSKVFTLNQWELAKACGVSRGTLKRYLSVFERYGILEIKRWRYKEVGPSPSSYRLYFGNVIPADWRDGGGDWPVSARDTRGERGRGKAPG
jgi:hypothetical protein